jgi:hypothetical protein
MAGRVRVREIGDDEGNWLMRIVRRGSGSVMIVPVPAQYPP